MKWQFQPAGDGGSNTDRGRAAGLVALLNGARLRQRGFTLLELMIVCAIIAILAAIAYPSYRRYVVRTHRTAAETCLSELSNYMERYYTTNLNYATSSAGVSNKTLPPLDCKNQTKKTYTYKLANVSSTAYKLQATPIGGQLADDKKCGILTLTQAGVRGKSGTGTVEKCWQ